MRQCNLPEDIIEAAGFDLQGMYGPVMAVRGLADCRDYFPAVMRHGQQGNLVAKFRDPIYTFNILQFPQHRLGLCGS